MIGGDVVRAQVPPDRAGYRLSLKTWLKELEYGRVMLRASCLNKDGKKLASIALEDMTETEAGWTVHEYAGLFETVGADVSTIQVYAALDGDGGGPAAGMIYMDDVELVFFQGEKADPDHVVVDFDGGSLLPGFLEYSNAFSRSADEASSGDASLLLRAPRSTGAVEKVVGGDIARVKVPPGTEAFALSMRTLLSNTGLGRLVLRADYFHEDRAKSHEIPLADISGTGSGWTENNYEHKLDPVDTGSMTLAIHAGFHNSLTTNADSMVYIDDIELIFLRPDPPHVLNLDFDTQYRTPWPIRRSKMILRSRDEAVSGAFSLLLAGPSVHGTENRSVGGLITRFDIPEGRKNYEVFIKTWLKELNQGALVLRVKLIDEYKRNAHIRGGRTVLETRLGQINHLEHGWTEHRFQGSLYIAPRHENVKSIALYAELDSQSQDKVRGQAYLDDLKIVFH